MWQKEATVSKNDKQISRWQSLARTWRASLLSHFEMHKHTSRRSSRGWCSFEHLTASRCVLLRSLQFNCFYFSFSRFCCSKIAVVRHWESIIWANIAAHTHFQCWYQADDSFRISWFIFGVSRYRTWRTAFSATCSSGSRLHFWLRIPCFCYLSLNLTYHVMNAGWRHT